MSTLKKSTDILLKLNPKFTKEAINIIIKAHIAPVNRKISAARVFSVTLPYVGTFKTHGNKKRKISTKSKAYIRKYHKKLNVKKHQNWTDEQLLY